MVSGSFEKEWGRGAAWIMADSLFKGVLLHMEIRAAQPQLTTHMLL